VAPYEGPGCLETLQTGSAAVCSGHAARPAEAAVSEADAARLDELRCRRLVDGVRRPGIEVPGEVATHDVVFRRNGGQRIAGHRFLSEAAGEVRS